MAVTKLYHRDLGFPAQLDLKEKYILDLSYTRHALQASVNDRYGEIVLPKEIQFWKSSIVEVETEDDINPIKLLVRIVYDSFFDLSIVILLNTGKVKTVWLNSINDSHTTLNINKYNRENV